METAEIDLRAEHLYNQCPTVKPAWSQLGETTRSVWRERAACVSTSPTKDSSEPRAKGALPESMSLF